MINEVMPPGEAGLFNQTLSGLAKIRYKKNSKKKWQILTQLGLHR